MAGRTYSLRTIFLAVGVCAFLSLVISMAVAGVGWAVGVAYALLLGAVVFGVFVAQYWFAALGEFFVREQFGPDPRDLTPFRTERPRELPVAEPLRIEDVVPGWNDPSLSDVDAPSPPPSGGTPPGPGAGMFFPPPQP